MALSAASSRCWQAFLALQANPAETQKHFLESFSIGDTVESKNDGARLILEGIKTTTSDLLWNYQSGASEAPKVGALSILLDGTDQPLAIVESIRVEVRAFSEVDTVFAYDYGEWDRTLES